jgi:WD40 repeat protein/serine/threonine protein kinase
MPSLPQSNDEATAAIRRIGRYEVLGLIGRGSFADVLRAWDTTLATHVAIKFLNEAAAADELLRERFVEEAQLLRRVHSEHVIGIHDVGTLDDGRLYLVVELADGGTLADRLDQRDRGPIDGGSIDAEPIDIASVQRIIAALAGGLTAVHAAGVIHRDIKPENLFLRTRSTFATTQVGVTRAADTVVRRGLLAPTEQLVIGDLGLAKDLAMRGSAPSVIGGSSGYQAPEQLRLDGEVGPATDVFAASAVLWRLLTGVRPGDSHEIAADLAKLPSGWQEFFGRALDSRPENRFPTMAAWESAALDHLDREPTILRDGRSQPRPATRASVCPYKGLAAFQADDADSFFGREELVAELVNRLQQHRVLVVAGPSGSGKSSLLRAGLLPALRTIDAPWSNEWPVDLITPGSQPFEELHYRLSRWTRGTPRVSLDALRADPKLARMMLDDSLERRNEPTARVLCIDQFEELFTHSAGDRTAADFVTALSSMVDPADSRLRVVLAVRADFYGRCAQIGWLAERITANQVLVGPMDRESMRRAIEEPARRSGLRLEPGLVDAVLLEGGSSPSSLPLMSHALVETWVRRDGNVLTLRGFREAGGVAGAIAQSADALFDDALDADQQAIARRLLLRLVTPGEGTADTRRRLPLDDLERSPEPVALRAVVDAFVDARLLSIDDSCVEIAHEALIVSWPRLRSWIDSERDNLRAHQRIGRAAREWDANERDTDLLYRGAPLMAAVEWAAHHRASLDVLEQAFLDDSENARLAGERVRAAAVARSNRARRRATIALAALALASVIASLLAFSAFQRARENARLAQQQFANALGTSALGQADSDPTQALLLAIESMARGPAATVDARSALVQARLELVGPGLVPLGPSVGTPGSFKVALRPDGQVAAVADQTGPIRLYETVTGAQIGADLVFHQSGARALDFSSDGTILVSGGSDGAVAVWDVATPASTPQPRRLYESQSTIWSIDVQPGDRNLITGGDDGILRIFDLASGRQTREIEWSSGAGVIAVAFSPDGSRIVASNRAGRVESWAASGGGALWNSDEQPEGPNLWEIVFTNDGSRFVTAGDRDVAVLHDAATGVPIPGAVFGDTTASGGPMTQVSGVAFSADGGRMIAGTADGRIHSWAVDDPADVITTAARHNGAVKHGAASRDGSIYVTVGDDKRLRVWQAPTTPVASTIRGFANGAFGVAFEPDGARIAVGDGSGNLHVTTLDGSSEDVVVAAHAGKVFDVDWSHDGRWIATVGDDGAVLLWNAETVTLAAKLGAHTGSGGSVSFSPNDRWIVSTDRSTTGGVFVWDVSARELRAELTGHAQGVRTAEFSVDGAWIATADGRGDIRVWSTADFTEQRRWTANPRVDAVWAVSFSADGLLASVDASEDLRVWDPLTGDQVGRTLSGLGTNGATGVGFNAAGDTIAVVTHNGELHVVDWRQGVNLASSRIIGHADAESFKLTFDAAGVNFATTGTDGSVQVWDLLSTDAACVAAGRRLDPTANEELLRGAEPIGCPRP